MIIMSGKLCCCTLCSFALQGRVYIWFVSKPNLRIILDWMLMNWLWNRLTESPLWWYPFNPSQLCEIYLSLIILEVQGQIDTESFLFFRRGTSEHQAIMTLNTSLLPEPLGYILKVIQRTHENNRNMELVATFSQGGATPQWMYGYRYSCQQLYVVQYFNFWLAFLLDFVKVALNATTN